MTIATWAASILALIFAMLFADAYWSLHQHEKREKGMRERLRQQEIAIAYWCNEARLWREAATQPRMVWPEQARNVWTKIHPN